VRNEPDPSRPPLETPPGGSDLPDETELDEATQSVSEALRISFGLLKFVMFGLLALYLVSGFFEVDAGHSAIVVQLGRIRGLETDPVLQEGAHWAWPWPIGEHPEEDTERTRTIDMDTFWFFVPEKYKGRSLEELQRRAPRQLHPARDGYLLSGDQEIVHLQCQIKYKISDLVDYVMQIGEADKEQHIVRTVAEWATVRTVAGMRSDDVVRGQIDALIRSVKRLMQERLDSLRTGIEVVDVVIPQRTVPLQVRPAYLAVVRAENEKQKIVSEARTQATQILNQVAGAAYEPLSEAIARFEIARDAGQKDEAEAQKQEIFRLLASAGGEVARIIGDALAFRTREQQKVHAEVRRFNALYPKYKQNPSIFMRRLWQDVRERILSSVDVEIFYLPRSSKEIRLMMSRNPQHLREREMRKYREEVR